MMFKYLRLTFNTILIILLLFNISIATPIYEFDSEGNLPFDIVTTNYSSLDKYYVFCPGSNEINVFNSYPYFNHINTISIDGIMKGKYSTFNNYVYLYCIENETSYIYAINNSSETIVPSPYNYQTGKIVVNFALDDNNGVLYGLGLSMHYGEGVIFSLDMNNNLNLLCQPVFAGYVPIGIHKCQNSPYLFITDRYTQQYEYYEGEDLVIGDPYDLVRVFDTTNLPPEEICEIEVSLNPEYMITNRDETKLYVMHNVISSEYPTSITVIDVLALPEIIVETICITNYALFDPVIMGEDENETIVSTVMPYNEHVGVVSSEIMYYNIYNNNYYVMDEYNLPLFRLEICPGEPKILASCLDNNKIVVINIDVTAPICQVVKPDISPFVAYVNDEILFEEFSDDDYSYELEVKWDFKDNNVEEYIKYKPYENTSIIHSYENTGVYLVEMKIIDQSGNVCIKETEVHVIE